MKLTFTVTNALPSTNYYCNFTVSNLDIDTGDPFESLPIKIQSVTLTPSGTYDGITATVSVSPTPTVLDPGQSAGGTVKISAASGATTGQNPVYTLTVNVLRWNE